MLLGALLYVTLHACVRGFLLAIHLGVEFLSHRVWGCQIVVNNSKLFSEWLWQFILSPAGQETVYQATIQPITGIVIKTKFS